jgi:glycerate-2-kinase
VTERLADRPAAREFEPGPVSIVGDAAAAARGAAAAAAAIGIAARVEDPALTGEAAEAGARMAAAALAASGTGMAVYAGETTVTLRGVGGIGGRNQELALAAGIALEGTEGILVASMGTDGIDGPTRAAGGIGDGRTVSRGRALGLEAAAALAGNDSGTYLRETGDRLLCGPTGTNVGDVVVAYRIG